MNMREKTVNVAIVEDDRTAMQRLCEMLDRFSETANVVFNKHCYGLATDFLENYAANTDIVFMDIQLPDLDGMTAAKKLREADRAVVLVFVTNFAQYALNGYDVNAADFIVKPIEYSVFASKLERIVCKIGDFDEVVLPVKTVEGLVVTVAASSLKYVEVMGHKLVFHTTHGNYSAVGNLYKAEERLAAARFVRCNSCYLVNPRFVEALNNYTTVVGGEELKISYSKRKEFRKAIVDYLGGIV